MASPRQQVCAAPAAVRAAIDPHFDGDPALYQAFAAACAAQFAHDAATGQASCDAGDLPALRGLAHNLKSALILLGHDAPSGLAAQVERQAAAGDLPSVRMSWRLLRTALLPLHTPRPAARSSRRQAPSAVSTFRH